MYIKQIFYNHHHRRFISTRPHDSPALHFPPIAIPWGYPHSIMTISLAFLWKKAKKYQRNTGERTAKQKRHPDKHLIIISLYFFKHKNLYNIKKYSYICNFVQQTKIIIT